MSVQRLPPGAADALLRAEGVTLEYRSGASLVRATDSVSFEVHRGDRLVLLGPSGCGKSTLLKAIAGFIAPRAGSLTLDGRPILRPGPDRIVVFQEFDQLPPWKTVKGNVMFPLLAGGMAKAEAQARALHWIDKVGLSGFADAFPHTLSGGMKARVAIARALAMQPAILLMDEPFAALDALTRRSMQEELQTLWEEIRFTMLFVTHSIEEALVVGNRIVLLSPHPGRVRAELNSHEFDLGSAGSEQFQTAAQRIHGLLFGDKGLAPPGQEAARAQLSTRLPTPLSMPLSTTLSPHLSTSLSPHLSFERSTALSTYLPTGLPTSLPTPLPTELSTVLSTGLHA